MASPAPTPGRSDSSELNLDFNLTPTLPIILPLTPARSNGRPVRRLVGTPRLGNSPPSTLGINDNGTTGSSNAARSSGPSHPRPPPIIQRDSESFFANYDSARDQVPRGRPSEEGGGSPGIALPPPMNLESESRYARGFRSPPSPIQEAEFVTPVVRPLDNSPRESRWWRPPPEPIRHPDERDEYERMRGSPVMPAQVVREPTFDQPFPFIKMHEPEFGPRVQAFRAPEVAIEGAQFGHHAQLRMEDPWALKAVERSSYPAIVYTFVTADIPRQAYLYSMLGLPELYYSRATSVFDEVNRMGVEELARLIVEDERLDPSTTTRPIIPYPGRQPSRNPSPRPSASADPDNASPEKLRKAWKSFVDGLLAEWTILNLVSSLLLSAILTLLQIPSAEASPVTRWSALFSLVCGLASLVYGCVYIVRFGTMKKTYKAVLWVQDVQRSSKSSFWNSWTFLAMPGTWLGWSMIFFLVCITSFAWTTGTLNQPSEPQLRPSEALGPRIAFSAILGLGILYFCLVNLSFNRWGTPYDREWEKMVGQLRLADERRRVEKQEAEERERERKPVLPPLSPPSTTKSLSFTQLRTPVVPAEWPERTAGGVDDGLKGGGGQGLLGFKPVRPPRRDRSTSLPSLPSTK